MIDENNLILPMLLAFKLSGEHETLPAAEVLACLRAYNLKYKVKLHTGGILVVETSPASRTDIAAIARRLGMTHHIYEILSISSGDDVERLLKDVELDKIMQIGDTFAVRVSKACNTETRAKSMDIERIAGAIIKRKGYNVDLTAPKYTFVVLFVAHKCFLTLLLHNIDKHQFELRRPHMRPFFAPGGIMPKFARAIVNLSEVKPGEFLIDPFCGTGGILIEAGMVGAMPVGMDIQEKMLRGTAQNMDFYRLNAHLVLADATRIPLKDDSIDAVVSDLPYGRASPVAGGINAEHLFEEASGEISRILKRGRKAVVVFNSPVLYRSLRDYGFVITERHEYRVHKSLKRYIAVLRRG